MSSGTGSVESCIATSGGNAEVALQYVSENVHFRDPFNDCVDSDGFRAVLSVKAGDMGKKREKLRRGEQRTELNSMIQ